MPFSALSLSGDDVDKKVMRPPSSDRKTIVENFFSLTLFQLIITFIPFLTVPYLIRVIGAEKFGLISFAYAFVLYFALLADYGFNYSALREISISKEDISKVSRIFIAVMTLKLCFLILSLSLIGVLCIWVPKFREDWPVYLASSGYLVGYVLFATFLFQGMEKMKYLLFLNLPSAAFTLLILILVKSEEDFLRVPLLGSAGSILVGLLALATAFRKLGIRWERPRLEQIQHEFKEGWSMFLSNLVSVGHGNIRILAVGLFAGDRITGYYTVAERLMNMLQVFPLSLWVQVVYPRLCSIFVENKGRFLKMIQGFQKVATLLYLLMSGAGFVFATWIVNLLCGNPAEEAITSLRFLVVALFLTAANAFRVQFFLVQGRREIVLKISLFSGGIATLLVFPLTLYLSYPGTALSLIVLLSLAYVLTEREMRARRL
ncbi:MAG: hypothetical protein A3G87_06895 [Omnitrophica bacterium RIFCSPLOWO2_12_FULL_50_11]|nr:MAG: hypothetical protein A3G87_06895 [Omnitrophica bacterium RIFCSPLOWO2_12_FULL_50_11]